MQWFLIHTKPRQEVIALENLERQGYACYLPMLPTEKLRQGKLVTLQEPLFPRYLFIQLGQGAQSQSWAPIRSTRGVSRLVSFGNEPAKVPSELVESLQLRDAEMAGTIKPAFHPGDEVKILEGPFAGLDAVYQMKDGEGRVMVLIELMSKPTQLKLQVGQVRRLA
jgi:transcriptional antiterminator RfaH